MSWYRMTPGGGSSGTNELFLNINGNQTSNFYHKNDNVIIGGNYNTLKVELGEDSVFNYQRSTHYTLYNLRNFSLFNLEVIKNTYGSGFFCFNFSEDSGYNMVGGPAKIENKNFIFNITNQNSFSVRLSFNAHYIENCNFYFLSPNSNDYSNQSQYGANELQLRELAMGQTNCNFYINNIGINGTFLTDGNTGNRTYYQKILNFYYSNIILSPNTRDLYSGGNNGDNMKYFFENSNFRMNYINSQLVAQGTYSVNIKNCQGNIYINAPYSVHSISIKNSNFQGASCNNTENVVIDHCNQNQTYNMIFYNCNQVIINDTKLNYYFGNFSNINNLYILNNSFLGYNTIGFTNNVFIDGIISDNLNLGDVIKNNFSLRFNNIYLKNFLGINTGWMLQSLTYANQNIRFFISNIPKCNNLIQGQNRSSYFNNLPLSIYFNPQYSYNIRALIPYRYTPIYSLNIVIWCNNLNNLKDYENIIYSTHNTLIYTQLDDNTLYNSSYKIKIFTNYNGYLDK